MKQDREWIVMLKRGEEDCLKEIYQRFRTDFIRWLVNKNHCDPDVAEDIYQVSFLTFYENVRLGKLTELKSSLKTYLFAIGKNKLRENRRRQERIVDNYLFDHIPAKDDIAQKRDQELRLKEIQQGLASLDESCKKILELFYFNRCSMQIISERLGLASANAAKMKKSRCLDKLRVLVNRDV